MSSAVSAGTNNSGKKSSTTLFRCCGRRSGLNAAFWPFDGAGGNCSGIIPPKTPQKIVRICCHLIGLPFAMAQKIPYTALVVNSSTRSSGSVLGLGRRVVSLIVTLILLFAIYKAYLYSESLKNQTLIIIITPTHRRPERFADMTRFSQTLMHVNNIHWIVVEDANATSPTVERLLERSHIPYTYFYATTKPGFPKRGWTHRNMGLEYVRKNYKNYPGNAVLYFADDDNSYDIRVFDRYIRNVKTIGVWAVGLAGGALVEAPHVENGVITKWDVTYAPSRKYATDMAGFAVNLNLILTKNATFHEGCVKFSPESCFLSQFDIPANKAQPFGYDDDPKEILVWHTKTRNIGTKGGDHGYITERR